MIDAKDFRIGNYLLLDTGFTLPQWHYIMPKDIYDISEGKVTLASIEPIPLTPEILEKCGFKLYSNTETVFIKKYNNQGELHIFNGGTQVGIANGLSKNDYYFFFNHIIHIIKYVHKLQNIYYSLTNTELNIQL